MIRWWVAPSVPDRSFQYDFALPAYNQSHSWLQTCSVKTFYAVPNGLDIASRHADVVRAYFCFRVDMGNRSDVLWNGDGVCFFEHRSDLSRRN